MVQLTESEDISVTTLRQYLRIPTVHPNPDYEPAVQFLCGLADEIGLEHRVVRLIHDKPIVILTLKGTNPTLPSLLLNSHMDVVPVFPEHWTHHPFGAHKDEDGNIYARGAQDMKSIGIQYVEAMRRLRANGSQLLRTVNLTFVPDEEIGGQTGMQLFVKSDEFKKLNVGLSLDEGVPSGDDVYRIYCAERVKWWLKVICNGHEGHGSKFIENTAAEQLQTVINKFYAFRENQKQTLANNSKLTLGDVTTVNMTILKGGVQVNVIPAEFVADFDIRVPPTECFEKLTKQFESWVTEAGASFEWVEHPEIRAVTPVDNSNPWWGGFSGVMDQMGLKYNTGVLLGGTDSRFLRVLGYPAFSFSPIIHTPQLMHDHDEYLNERVYLKGLDIYTNLIPALANLPAS